MRMLIDGERVEASSGEWMDVIDPATEDVVDRVPRGGADDVSVAVDAASDAQIAWAEVPPRRRGRSLLEAAERVRARSDEIAMILVKEQGKPLAEAKGEMAGFANVLEYYASVSGVQLGSLVDVPGIGRAEVHRVPLGVCAAIIPWNVPALIMAWKVAPALVTGNSIVIKPASSTPMTVLRLAQEIEAAGVPRGVVNVVTGPGAGAGNALAAHCGVAKLSFTGDTTTGRRVAEVAGPTLKRTTLELGGSDPSIVCPDADLRKAAAGIVGTRFYNCGQACTSLKRLFVHEDVADELLPMIRERVSNLRVGNGMDPGVNVGPLNNSAQRDEVEAMVDDLTSDRQGEVVVGGSRVGDRGYFYEPTLITGVDADARVMREEVFGPVLPMATFSDMDEAFELASSTPYGLGASIWTSSLENVDEARSRIRSGMLWVNMHLRVPVETPFGGMRASGIGRENSIDALREHTEARTVISAR